MNLPAGIVSSLSAPASAGGGILVPGRNCWKIAEARRFAVALDAGSQGNALRQSLLGASRTIFIVGWHIDSQTLLGEDPHDAWPRRLGDLLYALLQQRPALRVYVLAWDFCMLYSGQREWPPVYRQTWPHHRRLVHRLDARHPTGGAHHQNFVVIDDTVAFVGGLDLARDTRSSALEAEANAGARLGVQAVFDGPAAALMGELARMRWELSAGRRVASRRRRGGHHIAASDETQLWPPSLSPDMYDVPIGISRTESAYAGRPATGEIRQLLVDAVHAARHTLYFENGYFTSQVLAQALSARLARQDAPETILVTQAGAAGWLDEAAMAAMRAEIHLDIQRQDAARADAARRYHAYCPPVSESHENEAAAVRSKLFIVDDRLLCLGSANLSNRSMMLDTECQVTVEAAQAAHCEAISRVRARVLAARLKVDEQILASAIVQDGVAGAISRMDPAGAGLAPFSPQPEDMSAAAGTGLWVDRERPVSPDRLIAQFMSEPGKRPLAQRLLAGAIVVALILAAGGVWRWTPLSEYLNLGVLMKMGYLLKALPYASLAVIGCYIVGGLLAMPVTVLIAASGMVFGAWQGGIYALAGTMLSALVTYALGRMLGRDTVRSLAGPRINALSERIAARGILAMVVLRVLPVAPFTMVNVMAGASRIRLSDYLLGTFLGMLPGIVLTVAFANQLARMLQHPDLESVLIVTGAGLLMAGVAFAIQRVVDGLSGAGRQPGSRGSA